MDSDSLADVQQQQRWQPGAAIEILHRRAEILQRIREWFRCNNILEVETPVLCAGAVTDPHIDSFVASSAENPKRSPRYLRTSAEFHLKRLLVAGSGDVYELGKVFRVDECGRYHNPEFTMLEWYRCGLDHLQLVAETEQLLACLHGPQYPGMIRTSYRELWMQASGIDVASCSCAQIAAFLQKGGCEVPASITANFDALLDLGMGTLIAEGLDKQKYTCIYNYPASQAALARIDRSDSEWPCACRFEIYFGAVELANGYHELKEPGEQRDRFAADNATRIIDGKQSVPIDDYFLAALEQGLPDCAGVAVGIDRLLMILIDEIESLDQVLGFDWSRA